MPTRALLDVDNDHPVLFDASYVLILNSYALRKRGIDRNTPNPPGGEIGKDGNGEPNGILKNAPSLIKDLNREGPFSRAEKLTALEDQLKRYVEAGLTTWVTAPSTKNRLTSTRH
jgi:predicted amidohydrolase YtcJ